MACLTCSRALRAQVFYVVRCQRVLRASVTCMLSCSRDNVSYVPSCLCVPARSCAITSNMKNIKFSMTCFSYIFGIFSLSFSCEIMHGKQECLRFLKIFFENSAVHSGIFPTRRKPLMSATTSAIFV